MRRANRLKIVGRVVAGLLILALVVLVISFVAIRQAAGATAYQMREAHNADLPG